MTAVRHSRGGPERVHRIGGAPTWLRVALLALVGLLPAVDASAWWNTSWSHRRKLTLNNTAPGATAQTAFPVLIVLDSLNVRIDYGKTQNAGQDLRFVDDDDTTLLAHEIEKWDESGNSSVWVRVPLVNASNTDFIWVYYGNPTVGDGQNPTGVWDVDFKLVHHLRETSGVHVDSTSNPNDSFVVDVAAQGSAAGQINGADSFSTAGCVPSAATCDNIDVLDNATLDVGAAESMTVEAWIRTPTAGVAQHIAVKEAPGGVGTGFDFLVWSSNQARFGVTNSGLVPTDVTVMGGSVADNAWHYVVGRWTRSSSTANVFVDGVLAGTASNGVYAASPMSNTQPFRIGERGDANAGGLNFNGTIDEVRFSKAATPRSDSWIRAQYDSMRDSGVGLVGPFVSYGPEAAQCCGLGVTQTTDAVDSTTTTITVNGPNRFDLRFNVATGAGIDRFVDAEEDTGFDLAGGTAAALQPTLLSDEVGISGSSRTTGANTQGAELDLLEATPARVKVRQEAFYQQGAGSSNIAAGVKSYGDYSIYGIGRIALGLERRATVALATTSEQLQLSVHYQAAAPLNAWTGYSQTAGPFASVFAGQTGPATDQFVLAQTEQPSARTDFLSIISQDWADATRNTFFGANAGEEWEEVSWIDNDGTAIPIGSQRWNFLTYFKPTILASNVDTAVVSRSADYRGPDQLTINAGKGFQWVDTAENTVLTTDWFNESEAAYPLDLHQTLGLEFAIDGSSVIPRYRPFFKIRQWRSFIESPTVTFDPDGPGAAPATSLLKNTSYRAAVKPVARAHFSQDTLFHSTLQSAASQTGSPATVVGAVTFTPARFGSGAEMDADGEYLSIPSAGNFNPAQGAIEFWYKPRYDYSGGGPDPRDHALFGYWINGSNYFYAYLDPVPGGGPGPDEGLTFAVSTTASGLAKVVTGAGGAFTEYWRANEWVHLRFVWKAAPGPRLEIYINGKLAPPSGASLGSYTTAVGTLPNFYIGERGRDNNADTIPDFDNNPDGIIDEFYIYGQPDAPRPIAHGGLTTDTREFLADTADNFSLVDFDPIQALTRGEYLYFGADAKFRGLNVNLATAGTGVGATAVLWEYWDGTRWSTLPGVTDQTDSFTKPGGTIFWVDPASWNLYSVNGGPDLYYVRASLTGGVDYATPPVERVIKTDILLFQYCHDIMAAAGTFAFGVPWPTTEVSLQSFAAVAGDSAVLLEWRTASELRNLGFHLYRSHSQNGPWTRLTSSLIPGLGSSAVGQAYSFHDSGLTNGTRYFYRLDDVDASSKTTSHGPVSAVPGTPAPTAGGTSPSGGASGGSGGKPKSGGAASCPDWVLAAYASASGASSAATSLRCTRHGDPEASSLGVVSRDTRSATLELRTGGFYALHTQSGASEPSGTVRVFVPGFDFPQDEKAAALPIRRALVDAIVGRRVQLGGVRALDRVSFKGLVPSALGKAEMRVGRDGTVRAVRRGAAQVSSRFPKGELVTLLPSLFQGERKSAVVEIAPLRFDAERQQLVLARRVRVRLVFAGRETNESGRGSLGRAPGSRKPAVSGEVLARLYATSRGLHAASFEQLFPGRARGFAASQLRLERQGEPVGFHIEPASDNFGPGSRLYFFVDRTSASTDFTAEVAYELVRSRDGLRMPLVSAAPSGDAISSASTGFASFETNRFYQPGLLDAPDLWLWEALASGATRVKPFSLSGVSGSGAAELDVYLQGGSESGEPVDHHVSVSINGSVVGEARFAGKKPYRMSLSLASLLLREGANELQLTSVADTGVSSFFFLDRFALAYPQAASVSAGVFDGSWAEAGTASVSGAGAVLLDVSGAVSGAGSASTAASGPTEASSAPTRGVRWLLGFESSGESLRFRAEAGRRYLAVSPEALLSPRIGTPEPSTLRAATNQADYVLVAPRAFLAAAEPLLARRADQGLTTRAVAFEEIADQFGHGQASAEAIGSFLAYAFHSWTRPSPRYVLLLGDSSYDPRNFSGTSQPSPLPALWAKTSYLWTVSDPLLAAVNGEDSLPDLAIGRLPATTAAQAEALVAKLLAWEDSGQGLAGPAALVADNPDVAGDFEADVEDIRASYLGSREARVLKLSELGAQMRPSILDALNSGLSYLSYVGHGGAAVWASENVWNSWDAPSLQAQSQQPLLVTMNCLNGYFVAPSYESLSESLLKAEGRGAIASFSPSGLSLDGPAHQYHRALMAELTSTKHERLGDAILAAQKIYADSGLMPELVAVYHLLGDPATVIR